MPNRVCEGSLQSDQRTIPRWFDSGCVVAPPAFTYGSSGTNILRGPAFQTVDFAVHKNVALWSEASRLQFRVEGFNILSNADFRLPNFNIGVPAGRSRTR